jgi:hypothetical protein
MPTDSKVQTPAFRRWFKNSVVVNPDGTPKVVYHGTDRVFRRPVFRPGAYGVLGAGLYFTEDLSEAKLYAGKKGYIIPVFLSIQNPASADYVNDVGVKVGAEGPAIGQYLAQAGFDGVVDSTEGHYVVYDPRQIKSAVNNSGAFDPADPNILHGLPRQPRHRIPLGALLRGW